MLAFDTKRQFWEEEGRLASSSPRVKRSNRALAVARLARLWSVNARRLVLCGARVPLASGGYSVARAPAAQAAALRQVWSPVFSASKTSVKAAKLLFNDWGEQFDFMNATPPRYGRSRLQLQKWHTLHLVQTVSPTSVGHEVVWLLVRPCGWSTIIWRVVA